VGGADRGEELRVGRHGEVGVDTYLQLGGRDRGVFVASSKGDDEQEKREWSDRRPRVGGYIEVS
jgi:hypothetical protein